jgi:hypothetical protein
MDPELIETTPAHPNDSLAYGGVPEGDPEAVLAGAKAEAMRAVMAEFAEKGEIEAKPAPKAEAKPAAEPAPAPPADDKAALFARIAAMDAEIAALKRPAAEAAPIAPPPKPSSISVDDLRYNPMAALKAAGVNPEVLAQFMVAEHAGPNAPVDFRVQAALMPQLGAIQQSVRSDMAGLQARLDEYESRERLRAYNESLNKFVDGVSDEKYPTIARAIKADRAGTLEDVINAVRDDARARAAEGQDGEPIGPEEAVKRVEARYAALAKRLAASVQTPAPSQNGGATTASKQAPPATMASLSRVTPPPARARTIEDIEAEAKEEILRKYAG